MFLLLSWRLCRGKIGVCFVVGLKPPHVFCHHILDAIIFGMLLAVCHVVVEVFGWYEWWGSDSWKCVQKKKWENIKKYWKIYQKSYQVTYQKIIGFLSKISRC